MKEILAILIFILLAGQLNAQQKDSLLLEKAFKNKDNKLAASLFNRWSREDLKARDTTTTDTTRLIKRIYEAFVEKFLQKKMAGYYAYRDREPDGYRHENRGMCRFSLQKAPFLLLQDQLQYRYSALNITAADFADYIKWKTDENGQMPKSVVHKERLYALGRSGDASQPAKTIAYTPAKRFWEQITAVYGHKPVLYSNNSRRKNCLVHFMGYKGLSPGYVIALNVVDEERTAYKEREARAAFLNATLRFDDQLATFIAGNYALKLTRMEFLKNRALVLIKYRVDACFYSALFDLNRIGDVDYVPLSVFTAIE